MRKGTISGDAVRFIKNRDEFQCGSMSGGEWDLNLSPFTRLALNDTWLPKAWIERFIKDEPTYVVFSFWTPIAWVAKDGREVIPPVRYSTRTNLHQSKVYQAMQSAARFSKLREPAPYELVTA